MNFYIGNNEWDGQLHVPCMRPTQGTQNADAGESLSVGLFALILHGGSTLRLSPRRRYSVVINNGDKGLSYYVVLNNTSCGQWVAIITVPFPPRIMRARLTRV